VQIASDPRMPKGRSRCGFLVSCAAVETASLSDDSQSDLELFHEWLDGLKK